jgi:phthiocerol/phenolphthiocerol synthesis type-I polyketide synthase E
MSARRGAEHGRGPRWLLCRRRRPEARLRVYCFPHSGGSPGEYMAWTEALPEVELWGVQAPGRGSRAGEPPFTSMPELVDAVVGEVDFVAPYVFFGHSLGALVAYEVAVALRDAGRPGPEKLWVSGSRAPHLRRPDRGLHRLHGRELAAAVDEEYGAIAPELLAAPDLLEMLLPVLRADLAIGGGYQARPRPPLDCPITVLGGEDDRERGDLLTAWRRHTTGSFEVRTFPGGHFYFRERRDDVLRHLAERARAAVPAGEPGPSADAVVAAVWRELFGVSQIGPDDDFYALGGHSMLAVRMAARLRSELGLRVPVRTILENPTVDGLALLLARALDTTTPETGPTVTP